MQLACDLGPFELHPATDIAIRALGVSFDSLDHFRPHTLHLFVDGSFFRATDDLPAHSVWSMIVLMENSQRFSFLGYACDRVVLVPFQHATVTHTALKMAENVKATPTHLII